MGLAGPLWIARLQAEWLFAVSPFGSVPFLNLWRAVPMQILSPHLQIVSRNAEAAMPDDEKTQPSEVVWVEDSGGHIKPVSEKVLSLANVAKMFGISPWLLRYYEFRGLIKRNQIRDGIRVYCWADCERVAFIIKCRRVGVRLHDVMTIIEAIKDDATPLAFRTGQELCMALVDQLERRRRAIGDALSELSHTHAKLSSRALGDWTGRNRV